MKFSNGSYENYLFLYTVLCEILTETNDMKPLQKRFLMKKNIYSIAFTVLIELLFQRFSYRRYIY